MPVADSVVIDVDTPYVVASNGVQDLLGPLANFKIICYVPSLDNAGNLQGVETMMVAVWNKLATSGISIRAQSISLGHFAGPSGELTAAEISLSILTTWS